MSEQKLLVAAQLQQMQDLNEIMSNQVQPQVLDIAETAYQHLSVGMSASSNAGEAAYEAGSTAAAAQAIAAKLSVLVEQALGKQMQMDYVNRGGTDAEILADDSGQVLQSKVVAAWNKDPSQRSDWEDFLVNHYGKDFLQSEYLSGWKLQHPNATQAEEDAAVANYWNTVTQYDTWQGAINATRTGANAYYSKSLLDAYDASDIGEPASSPSSGSGGSGGDGDDKDNGSKKERVDLVICNKKEIPKLNVNLFKNKKY